jgi:transposase
MFICMYVQWVLEFFTERPNARLADATAAIWERFDVNVSLKSVANILHKHRWSRSGQRDSNKTTVHAPGAVPHVAVSGVRVRRLM